MKVNDVLRRLQAWAGDNSATFVTLTDALDLINDAQLEVNLAAEALQSTAAVNVVAGTDEYALPADFALAKRATYDGSKLMPSTYEMIDALDWDKDSASNAGSLPSYYYINGGKIGLYPKPSVTLNNGLKILYVIVPTALTVGTDDLSLPILLHPVVSRICFALVKERDEDFEAANQIRAATLMQLGSLLSAVRNGNEESYPAVRDIEAASLRGYWE